MPSGTRSHPSRSAVSSIRLLVVSGGRPDVGSVSRYAFQNCGRLAVWIDGRECMLAEPSEIVPELPPGWTARTMTLVDAAAAAT